MPSGVSDVDEHGKPVIIKAIGSRCVHDIYYKPEDQLPCASGNNRCPVDCVAPESEG